MTDTIEQHALSVVLLGPPALPVGCHVGNRVGNRMLFAKCFDLNGVQVVQVVEQLPLLGAAKVRDERAWHGFRMKDRPRKFKMFLRAWLLPPLPDNALSMSLLVVEEHIATALGLAALSFEELEELCSGVATKSETVSRSSSLPNQEATTERVVWIARRSIMNQRRIAVLAAMVVVVFV